MESLWQDLRFALRMLGKNPVFTAVAVLTLALGIGANTAIFSVVNAVLLKPLPYPDAARLISVSQTDLQDHSPGIPVSFTKYEQIRSQGQTVEASAAYYNLALSLTTHAEPEAVPAARVSEQFFRTLGIAPSRGRDFLPEEEKLGGSEVAIVSDAFWHTHFGGEEALLGRPVTLGGKNVTVVGILPKSFRFPLQFPEPEVWLPRVDEMDDLRPEQIRTGAGYLNVIARLRPSITLSQARAELKTIDARYRAQFGSNLDATKYELDAITLEESLVGGFRPSLVVLVAAVGFVLLIACANVANLLLARATAREKEIAVRKALGASRMRLVRQLLSESVLLSFAGGVVGILLSGACLQLLRTLPAGTVPRLAEAAIDVRVLLFSLGLCLLTGIAFGLAPALQASKGDLQSALKSGARGSSAEGSRPRIRALLVVAETAVALVLLTGAGLLIESFAKLLQVNPGFTSERIVTFPLTLPAARYSQPRQQADFYRQLLERAQAISGIQAVGWTTLLPLSGGGRFVFFCPEGRACLGIGKDPVIALREVSPDFFETTETPLLSGRSFNDGDRAGKQPVAIVNEIAAKRYWPGQNAIGKRLANSRDMIQREIVGVVADVKFRSLDAPDAEEMYLPIDQNPRSSATLVVRSDTNSQTVVTAIRAKVAELDSSLPVSGILRMDDVVSASVAQPRMVVQFVGVFAGLALLLAAIGIYGVMGYSVAQRRQELGIRLALGAKPGDIFKLVVGNGMRLTFAGIAAGVVASLILTRLLSSLLFGVRALDPVAFVSAVVVLALASLIACYVPARRATSVDPIAVLRSE